MHVPVARFTGRVRLQSGTPAYGCRVVLLVTGTPHVVSETWTSSRGEFVLEVPPDRLPPGEMASSGFTLQVVDGTHTVLVDRSDVIARAGHTTRLDLVTDARAMVTLPVALPLTRAHLVPIIRPEALAVVDAALGLLAAVGSDAHAQYARGARQTLPPPGHVEELLELAWAALDGDPEAMIDLREVLAVQAAAMRRDGPSAIIVRHEKEDDDRARRRPKVSYGAPKEPLHNAPKVDPVTVTGRLLSARARDTDTDADDHRRGGNALEGAVLTERLIPLVVATVRVARSPGERVAFFDGLHGVLSGLSTIDRLHRAALEVLQDRRIAPLRALLALLQTNASDDTNLPLPMSGGTSGAAVDPSLPDLVDPWWERLQQAVHLTEATLRTRGRTSSPYHIDAVLPPDAAPGQRVVLRGTGFGDHAGDVAFDGASPVEPLSWSDTEIEAIVPEHARPGPVSLRVLQHVVRVHHKIVEIYRSGTGVPFEGGRPQVRSVLVDGRAEGSWVRPGDAAAVSWTTVAGQEGRVSVRVSVTDLTRRRNQEQVLFTETDLPASGSRIIGVPDVNTEHQLQVIVTVDNAVATAKRVTTWPVAVPPQLAIQGIEVTQGIQHAPWDPTHAAVPTVAGKDTMVRVYVTSERQGFQDDRTTIVSASLRIGDLTLAPIAPYDDEPGAVRAPFEAGRAYAVDRSRADHALIFRVPAPLCVGTRELHVEVRADGRPPHSPSAEARLTWTWTTVRPVPIRFVRIASQGAKAPSDAQARFTLMRALDLLPTPPDDIGPGWLASWNTAHIQGGQPDDPQWSLVLDELADMHDVSTWEWLVSSMDHTPPTDDDAMWVGIVPDSLDDHVLIDSRTLLTAPYGVLDPPQSPNRTATARRMVHVLDPTSQTEVPQRVHEVPFDPFWCTTVVDPRHGVRDLSGPPGAAWISAARWRALVERL